MQLVFLYKLVEGVAESSFGTHVANLAGVPEAVVKRAEVVSEDFARQFKARVEDKRKTNASGSALVPIEAQADFAFLVRLAMGQEKLPENRVVRREMLRCLRAAVPKYVISAKPEAMVA